MFEFFCLMRSGPGLTNNIRNYLLKTAFGMIKDNSEKQSVKTDEFEGMVQTNFETVVIGSVCGFLFFAELDVDTDTDTSESTTKVKYLVPDIDFDVDQYKIQWLPYSGKHQNAPFN